MKQGQSGTMHPPRNRKWSPAGFSEGYNYPAYSPPPACRGRYGIASGLGGLIIGLVHACWLILTSPIRLVFWIIAFLGRLTGVILGFSLMVVGMALWAGPFFIVGIPLFIIGLLMTLRCLG